MSDPKDQTSSAAPQESPAFTPPANMEKCLDQFSRTFEASARRWELIVYPSLLAFIVLAAYGFYLIYRLTNNVDVITGQMQEVVLAMQAVSEHMHVTTLHMAKVTEEMRGMGEDTQALASTIVAMADDMDRLNQSASQISETIYQMRMDTATMGQNIHNVSGPMRFMNNFMPW